MLSSFAAVIALTLATPAISATPADSETANKPAKEKKVCRAAELSGTRLGGRMICKTKAEWDADAAATRKSLDARSRQQ